MDKPTTMNAISKFGVKPKLRLMQKPLIVLLLILGVTINVNAQRKQHQVRQTDNRFNIRLESYFSTLTGDEEFFYYVKNNTSKEYNIVVEVTANYSCVGERKFKLGVNRVVYLPPNGEFTPKSDWVHYVLTSDLKGKAKECAMKFGDSYTYLKDFSYTISGIKDLTEEKAEAEKKKQEALVAKQKKLEADKAEKDRLAKEATAKKATVASGSSNKGAANANVAKATSTSGTTKEPPRTTKSTTATGNKIASTSSVNVSTEEVVNKQQQEAKQRAEDEARKKAEAEELAKKQQAYDNWKAQKDKEQSLKDVASFAASVGLMTIVGGWIYDGMGKFDPMFALEPKDEKKIKFHMGLDFGYSLSTMPILFASNKNTMVGGKEQNTKDIQEKQPFTFNLEAIWKLGVDHQNYGAYAYLSPKLGFSPIFDGYQFSPLNFGARAYGGAKWAKVYFGYGGGQRQMTHSSHDTEETGKGNAVINYGKMEFGLLFTTNPDQNYRRTHISIGMINEKFKPYDAGGFGILDPETGTLKFDTKTNKIQGFAFQLRKDHTFNWYINVYPEFVYSGEIKGAGALSSSFSDKKTGTFFEMGFIRALDFY